MSTTQAQAPVISDLHALRLDIEEFLYLEADLLDERRFEEWLELVAEDIRYRMPMVRNLKFDEIQDEYQTDPLAIHWMDEGKETLEQRVRQILTGVHWAEEPLSRTSHLVTNVRVTDAQPSVARAETVTVKCRFLLYRNRLQDEEDFLIGKRVDGLRRAPSSPGGWQIARRDIYLDQTVLLAKNLTALF